MATLFQALSAFPGKVYSAFGQVADVVTGRRAERERERNQKDLVDFFQEKLVSAFRAGRVRMLPYYDNLTAETAEHRQAYRWLLKEPAIKSAFMAKLLSVMSLDLQVDPASETPRDKEIATFVEDALTRCKGGMAEIIWAILFGALLEGNGLAEKVWGRIDRGKYRGRPAIVELKSKDSHDYQIGIDEFNNPTQVISRRTADEFPMSDFTFWSHMPGFSNPAGMSDLRAVYRAGWMLDTVWKLRAIGLERFTLPIFMSKYPAGRLDIRDSINEAVKKAKSLGFLTIPEEAMAEAVEMASKSGSDFDAAIKGLQEECFIGIQGATLQALAGQVPDGSGKSSVHKSTTELFVWYLATAAANVANDQLIPDLVDLNYNDADYPRSWLGGVNDGDLKAALDIDIGLLQLGLIQDPKDLARRYRRQMAKNPQEAMETLRLIKTMGIQPQPMPGGDGGMGGAQPFEEQTILTGKVKPLDGGQPSGTVPFVEELAEDGYYHGATPPGEGLVQVGTGPKGGKIWKAPDKNEAKPAESNPFTGKAAHRYKPKPEGWGDPIIPGNEPKPIWNLATSSGYARAKPLIDEVKRIHADPAKATKEDVRALAQKIASTTGRDALYTLALAAGVKGGKAKDIAKRIVGPLGHDVGDLPENDMTKEAALQKKVKAAGGAAKDAKQVTGYARQMRDDQNKEIDYHNDAVKYAYSILSKENGGRPFTQNHPAFNGGDHNSVRGFDTMAREVNSHYPGLFGTMTGSGSHGQNNDSDQEKLWAMLSAGPKPRLTINDTFPQVMDEWEKHGKGKKDESVPFQESSGK